MTDVARGLKDAWMDTCTWEAHAGDPGAAAQQRRRLARLSAGDAAVDDRP